MKHCDFVVFFICTTLFICLESNAENGQLYQASGSPAWFPPMQPGLTNVIICEPTIEIPDGAVNGSDSPAALTNAAIPAIENLLLSSGRFMVGDNGKYQCHVTLNNYDVETSVAGRNRSPSQSINQIGGMIGGLFKSISPQSQLPNLGSLTNTPVEMDWSNNETQTAIKCDVFMKIGYTSGNQFFASGMGSIQETNSISCFYREFAGFTNASQSTASATLRVRNAILQEASYIAFTNLLGRLDAQLLNDEQSAGASDVATTTGSSPRTFEQRLIDLKSAYKDSFISKEQYDSRIEGMSNDLEHAYNVGFVTLNEYQKEKTEISNESQ